MPFMLGQLHRSPHHVCIAGGVHLAFIPEASSSPTDTVDHETSVIGRGSASLQKGETATLRPITDQCLYRGGGEVPS